MALPVVSGRKAVKALTKAGYRVTGRKGSHIKLKKKVDFIAGGIVRLVCGLWGCS